MFSCHLPSHYGLGRVFLTLLRSTTLHAQTEQTCGTCPYTLLRNQWFECASNQLRTNSIPRFWIYTNDQTLHSWLENPPSKTTDPFRSYHMDLPLSGCSHLTCPSLRYQERISSL